MTDTMVETFKALRVVDLGTCKRQAGDFIPEYTDPAHIAPNRRDRLVRMGYIERRTVPQSELDAWQKRWDEENAPKADAEDSGAEEGESFGEENPDPETEEALVIPVVLEEESIEDLGPVEEPEEESSSVRKAPAKKVVRAPRNSRRRS